MTKPLLIGMGGTFVCGIFVKGARKLGAAGYQIWGQWGCGGSSKREGG